MSTAFTEAIHSPSGNSSRVYLERFLREAAASVPGGAMVLDAGAGECLYKPLFKHTKYESADFAQADMSYGKIDYICDLTSIPVDSEKYDLVILTQVLEHVPEPHAVLNELHRVLKPGGHLWMTAPLYYEEHLQPYDFYRYTQFGFKHLLEANGFKMQGITWLEGYLSTLSYQLDLAAKSLPRNPQAYGGGAIGIAAAVISTVSRPSFRFLSRVFKRLDLRKKITTSGHCKNYAIIAVK